MNEFIYLLRVHVEDTDYGGVVYHSNYLNFMERARSEWVEQLGMGLDWQRKQEIAFVVQSVNIQYLKPARLHEMIEVVSSIKEMRRASIIFEQYLRPAGVPDKILCKAEIRIACTDFNIRSRALPEMPMLAEIRRSLT